MKSSSPLRFETGSTEHASSCHEAINTVYGQDDGGFNAVRRVKPTDQRLFGEQLDSSLSLDLFSVTTTGAP